jgi:hypothetical protein
MEKSGYRRTIKTTIRTRGADAGCERLSETLEVAQHVVKERTVAEEKPRIVHERVSMEHVRRRNESSKRAQSDSCKGDNDFSGESDK